MSESCEIKGCSFAAMEIIVPPPPHDYSNEAAFPTSGDLIETRRLCWRHRHENGYFTHNEYVAAYAVVEYLLRESWAERNKPDAAAEAKELAQKKAEHFNFVMATIRFRYGP